MGLRPTILLDFDQEYDNIIEGECTYIQAHYLDLTAQIQKRVTTTENSLSYKWVT